LDDVFFFHLLIRPNVDLADHIVFCPILGMLLVLLHVVLLSFDVERFLALMFLTTSVFLPMQDFRRLTLLPHFVRLDEYQRARQNIS
jgi:hypothetical protein